MILQPTIGVFDSGVGGLSILGEIRLKLPQARFVYCSDNKNFPYGPKTGEEVIEATMMAVSALVLAEHIDILVIACGTASTIVLPHLRKKLNIEVVGVVPAIKPAAAISQSKVIGLLATPGTVKRPYTAQLIADYAKDCEVISVGSSELVAVAERFIAGESIPDQEFDSIVQPFIAHASELDTMVLACTHFPLLKTQLAKAMPFVRYWVDSGAAIGRRIDELFLAGRIPTRKVVPETIGYFTAQTASAEKLIPILKSRFGFASAYYLTASES